MEMQILNWERGKISVEGDQISIKESDQYTVHRPLEVFRDLANAGKAYDLCDWQTSRKGLRIKASLREGQTDDALFAFCEKWGLPIVGFDYGRPSLAGVISSNSAWLGTGRSLPLDNYGYASPDLRTTAALAHLCYELKQVKRANNFRERVYETSDGMLSFLPHCDIEMPRIGSFPTPANSRLLKGWAFGVSLTIAEIAGWYLRDGIRMVLEFPRGRTKPPRVVPSCNGLLSFIWYHFTVDNQFIDATAPRMVLCRRDDHHHGCGKWFWSETGRGRICPDCNRQNSNRRSRKYRESCEN